MNDHTQKMYTCIHTDIVLRVQSYAFLLVQSSKDRRSRGTSRAPPSFAPVAAREPYSGLRFIGLKT